MGRNINEYLEEEAFKKKYEMDEKLLESGQKITWKKIINDGVEYNYKRIVGKTK